VQSPEIGRAACDRFVERFVRPHGRDVAGTPLLVEALEKMAARRRPRATTSPLLYPLRALLRVAGTIALSRERRRARALAAAAKRRPAPGDARADVPTTKAG